MGTAVIACISQQALRHVRPVAWLCRVFMVRATWLQPQTRYSDTEAGASRIVLQASMPLVVLKHVQ